jgi:hypothetical protein
MSVREPARTIEEEPGRIGGNDAVHDSWVQAALAAEWLETAAIEAEESVDRSHPQEAVPILSQAHDGPALRPLIVAELLECEGSRWRRRQFLSGNMGGMEFSIRTDLTLTEKTMNGTMAEDSPTGGEGWN